MNCVCSSEELEVLVSSVHRLGFNFRLSEQIRGIHAIMTSATRVVKCACCSQKHEASVTPSRGSSQNIVPVVLDKEQPIKAFLSGSTDNFRDMNSETFKIAHTRLNLQYRLSLCMNDVNDLEKRKDKLTTILASLIHSRCCQVGSNVTPELTTSMTNEPVVVNVLPFSLCVLKCACTPECQKSIHVIPSFHTRPVIDNSCQEKTDEIQLLRNVITPTTTDFTDYLNIPFIQGKGITQAPASPILGGENISDVGFPRMLGRESNFDNSEKDPELQDFFNELIESVQASSLMFENPEKRTEPALDTSTNQWSNPLHVPYLHQETETGNVFKSKGCTSSFVRGRNGKRKIKHEACVKSRAMALKDVANVTECMEKLNIQGETTIELNIVTQSMKELNLHNASDNETVMPQQYGTAGQCTSSMINIH